jgi:hypothetical protein
VKSVTAAGSPSSAWAHEGQASTAGMLNAVARALVDGHLLLSSEQVSSSRWYQLLSDRLQTHLALALWQQGEGAAAVAILNGVLGVDGANPLRRRVGWRWLNSDSTRRPRAPLTMPWRRPRATAPCFLRSPRVGS